MNWNKVSECMPPLNEVGSSQTIDVLFYNGDCAVFQGHYDYDNGGWHEVNSENKYTIAIIAPTHWALLPEFPEHV